MFFDIVAEHLTLGQHRRANKSFVVQTLSIRCHSICAAIVDVALRARAIRRARTGVICSYAPILSARRHLVLC